MEVGYGSGDRFESYEPWLVGVYATIWQAGEQYRDC
jgi:hypothetical protein